VGRVGGGQMGGGSPPEAKETKPWRQLVKSMGTPQHKGGGGEGRMGGKKGPYFVRY